MRRERRAAWAREPFRPFTPTPSCRRCSRRSPQRNNINTAVVDHVFTGCGAQSGKQGACIARMAPLDAGFDNEADAVAPAKFMRALGSDPAIVNVNGGAIAPGHPIGATGAIMVAMLLDEMERHDLNVGRATLCAAGAMAPGALIERM